MKYSMVRGKTTNLCYPEGGGKFGIYPKYNQIENLFSVDFTTVNYGTIIYKMSS